MRPTHLPNPHKLRGLLVYADPQTARTLADLFAACGQEIQVACDGATASELVRTHRPEVVFWDLRMRDAVRPPELGEAALVAIAPPGAESSVQGTNEGFVHYLVEPVDPVQVQALLRKLERARTDNG